MSIAQNEFFQNQTPPPQTSKNQKIEVIKSFLKKHQERIILTTGAVLIASLAFVAGRLSTNQKSVNFNKESLKGEVKVPIKKEIQRQINE
jgi:hypothetical protein